MSTQDSPHFLSFISSLEVIKERHGENTDKFQKDQVNRLTKLEREFRKALVRHPWGVEVYKKFVHHILREKRNILMARPYFRERDVTFKAFISNRLRKEYVRGLTRFNFNFNFIDFAIKAMPWDKENARQHKILELAEQVRSLRQAIIECNMPLAISQARMFYVRNQHSHMTYMDMIQVAAGGLASGVDKFVGRYTKTFRAVVIGRILGDLIEANSETFVHFFPADKRRIYRVRKIVGALRDGAPAEIDEITRLLNLKEAQEGEELTASGELHHLMGAAGVVLASSLPVPEEDGEDLGSPIEKYPDDPSNRPDNLLEEVQARRATAEAIAGLSVFDQKLLRLKGVDLMSV